MNLSKRGYAFSLKMLFAIVAVSAVVLVVLLQRHWQARWGGVTSGLAEWARQVDRSDHQIDHYRWVTYRERGGRLEPLDFVALTGEPTRVWLNNGEWDWEINANDEEDGSRFYILPPGRWVASVEDVLTTWERNDNAGLGPSQSPRQRVTPTNENVELP